MFFKYLFITAAALTCLCYADVSEINVSAAAQELLVPFNELLPPLEDTSSTTTTTTTSAPTAVYTKPTKKSYYQQQVQHIKEPHLINKNAQLKPQAQTQEKQPTDAQPQVQSLAVDLLPPLEDPVTNDIAVPEQQQPATISHPVIITTTTRRPTFRTTQRVVRPVVFATQKPRIITTTTTARPVVAAPVGPVVVAPVRPVFVAASRPVVHATSRPAAVHVAQRIPSSISYTPVATAAFSDRLIQEYATYFQHTTARPARGPLPTLTPFPRYRK